MVGRLESGQLDPEEIFEDQDSDEMEDPEADSVTFGRLFTQPYDLVVRSLIDQINDRTVHIREFSGRPDFQRWYVWTDKQASRLIESILLNIPIPPCFLSQDQEFQLDVIDGQQRIYSIYRFVDNQFPLEGLEVLTELNGKRFFELEPTQRRRIDTYTLRCVVVTNDSDPEIRFLVFERLNSNGTPLNAQELRNSISRGALNDLLIELAQDDKWLGILNRKYPDKRMRGEELILRFFAFHLRGLEGYATPQKKWLDDAAHSGRRFSPQTIQSLRSTWISTIDNCLAIFSPSECFRRTPVVGSPVVNRALMDLTMFSLSKVPPHEVGAISERFHERYRQVLQYDKFAELISRGVDHKSRTMKRFEIWRGVVDAGLTFT